MSTVHSVLTNILSNWGPLTLLEIGWKLRNEHSLYYSDSTLTARIRDLRKDKYGKHNVVRAKRGKVHLYHIPKDDHVQ